MTASSAVSILELLKSDVEKENTSLDIFNLNVQCSQKLYDSNASSIRSCFFVRSSINSSLSLFASSSDIRSSAASPPALVPSGAPGPDSGLVSVSAHHDSCCGGTLRVEQMR